MHWSFLQFGASGGNATDPDFSSVVLLAHFDGTNGSTTFPDSSRSAHTLTGLSGAVLTTAQQKFGTASLYANLTNGVNVAVALTDFNFGAGKFTVECWGYASSAPIGTNGLVTQFANAGPNKGWFFGFYNGSLEFFYSTTGSDQPVVGAAYAPPLNTWVHYAVDRDANNALRVYANGVVIASATVASTFFASTLAPNIGNDQTATRYWLGDIDDVRITKGVARYGGAFTPPTTAFPDS